MPRTSLVTIYKVLVQYGNEWRQIEQPGGRDVEGRVGREAQTKKTENASNYRRVKLTPLRAVTAAGPAAQIFAVLATRVAASIKTDL